MNAVGENTENTLFNWQSVTKRNGKCTSDEPPELDEYKKPIFKRPNRFEILSGDDDESPQSSLNSLQLPY